MKLFEQAGVVFKLVISNSSSPNYKLAKSIDFANYDNSTPVASFTSSFVR